LPALGDGFQGEKVWVCGVAHRTGTVAEWCGVLSGEELMTTPSAWISAIGPPM
jgi:hypothetical protein